QVVLSALRIIRREKIQILLTSSPPESTHVAGLIIRRFAQGIRWVADFRDLWTTKRVAYKPPSPVHDRIVRSLERRIYRRADHIIANTEGNRNVYLNDFGVSSSKITLLPGGYDPEEVNQDAKRDQPGGERVF